MLCEVQPQFILDESNLNGLKPWEANEYNLSDFNVPPEEEDPALVIEK